MEKRLKDARLNPYSIPVRVSMTNQLITSTLFYMVQLWPGDVKDLEWLDREIKHFILNGQEDIRKAPIEYAVLLRPKDQGGFGLISIKAQFYAMVAIFILWAAADGDLSEVRGGAKDFS